MLKVVLALFPLVSILFMIFILKKSSIFTGIFACLLTTVIATSPVFHLNIALLPKPFINSFLITLPVTYVLFFGILLYHLMEKSGSIQKIASSIATSTDNRIDQVLLLALGLSPLIESVSGFGLAVIVIAPILMALGFNSLQSSFIALISLCIIPWGTLAMGTIIGASLGNIPLEDLGVGSALMCIPIYIYFAFLVTYIGVGKEAMQKKKWGILSMGLVLGLSVWICNRFISVELAGVVGSLTMMAAIFIMISLQNRNKQYYSNIFLKNISPYLLLIALLIASRTINPIKDFLTSLLTVTIASYQFQLSFLYSPGFFLFIVCLFTCTLFRLSKASIFDSIKLTINKCYPVLLTTFLYIVVSEMMAEAEMIQLLSVTAANTFGSYFVFITPLIGATGGFLTGSNTASNTMFIRLQTETATHIGLSPTILACIQNVSSSFMTMVNPSRVALSCSVCKIHSFENIIQRKMALVGLSTLAIIFLEIIFLSRFH
ncbi:L-lactate permease [Lysinibacillus sp. FSL K6-3209]|uniref:L-lactate permease n=1 Tax=Lysinibacillus sp. FSL K6-3209 TaxID=2921497 RepID=UPI0030DB5D30